MVSSVQDDSIAVEDYVPYPHAMSEYIESAINVDDPELRQKNEARIDAMLKLPLYDYRALPQALVFHKSQKRYRWCLGGNRSSKSMSVAQEVMWFATGEHPFREVRAPNVGWYCTKTWDLVGEILWDKLQQLLEGIEHTVLWRNRGKGIPAIVQIPIYKNGEYAGDSRIIFKAYEQGREVFQGTERRYIANDEQFSHEIYIEQITRIGGGDPLDFFCAMTPIKSQPWLEDKLTNERPDSWDVFEYPLDDNRISLGGFIPDKEIDGLIAEWPEEVQPTRRKGKWSSFLGAVYKTFDREIHVVQEKDEDLFIPGGTIPIGGKFMCVGGIDFGANNPFVYLLVVRIPHFDNAWYVLDEYYHNPKKRGVRLIRENEGGTSHSEQIKKVNKKWNAHLSRYWADPEDKNGRNELRASGIETRAAKKDVEPGIECMQTLLKVNVATGRPRFFIAARCKNCIREWAIYSYPEGTDTRDPDENPLSKDDHCPDAGRYVVYSEAKSEMGPGIVLKGFARKF